MIILLFFFIAFSSGRCINKEEGLYLGMCDDYVTYPIYVNDNVSSNNNNFVIRTWLNQILSFKILVDTLPIQCALSYPTCVNGQPSGICKSNCTSVFSRYLQNGVIYNPCNTKIFYEDSKNDGSLCTRVLASDASRLFMSMMVLLSVLFIII